MIGSTCRLFLLLWLVALPASAARYVVEVYDACAALLCIDPNPVTIHAGDSVAFRLGCGDIYCRSLSQPVVHNIVADDGSFRCARGCDDDGGNGAPAIFDAAWGFERVLHAPGLVWYHDEYTGVRGLIVVLAGPGPRVVEYYNPYLGTYFITSDVSEQAYLDIGGNGGWRRTGDAFNSGGPAKVCRFVGNPFPIGRPFGPNSHFYTADAEECAGLKTAFDPRRRSWLFESEDFATTPADASGCPASLMPVYRAYNNGYAHGIDSNHRITANVEAYNLMLREGWIAEGIRMCAPR